MDSFINPKIYERRNITFNGSTFIGLYYKDNKGRDWYNTLVNWAGCISVDEQYRVCAFESDVSFMGMEEGRNVFEINPKEVPNNVIGNFTYQDGVFTNVRSNELAIAKSKKLELIHQANSAITPLQDAVDIDAPSDEEKKYLNAWKRYRLALTNLEISEKKEILWPKPPEKSD